jgi:hypothetical protein
MEAPGAEVRVRERRRLNLLKNMLKAIKRDSLTACTYNLNIDSLKIAEVAGLIQTDAAKESARLKILRQAPLCVAMCLIPKEPG